MMTNIGKRWFDRDMLLEDEIFSQKKEYFSNGWTEDIFVVLLQHDKLDDRLIELGLSPIPLFPGENTGILETENAKHPVIILGHAKIPNVNVTKLTALSSSQAIRQNTTIQRSKSDPCLHQIIPSNGENGKPLNSSLGW